MKKIYLLYLVFFCIAFSGFAQNKSMLPLIEKSLKIAEQQSMAMANELEKEKGLLPRSNDNKGRLVTSDSRWWCSGFFPGVLWYLYEYDKKPKTKKWAELYTDRVEREKYTTNNHDVGFMLYCSFGNGYRITKNPKYSEVLVTGAKSLSTRFRSKCGIIQSWDIEDWNKDEGWQIPVIIDNMMNLELLLFATRQTGDSSFYKIAISHAHNTLKNHFRPDFSSYHLVSYDSISGKPHIKQTFQGYNDQSAWARGQGWGLYGYTFMYGQTRKTEYLNQAKNIAAFILHHPNLPKDKIPYWDFNAPNIPNELRDASAGALIASALIELSQYVDAKDKREYLNVAEIQLRTLSSPKYLAASGTNANFILKHSVGFYKSKSEVDAPVTYADYYYVEALIRYKILLNKTYH